jgi:hypothetical protein
MLVLVGFGCDNSSFTAPCRLRRLVSLVKQEVVTFFDRLSSDLERVFATTLWFSVFVHAQFVVFCFGHVFVFCFGHVFVFCFGHVFVFCFARVFVFCFAHVFVFIDLRFFVITSWYPLQFSRPCWIYSYHLK